MGSSPSVSVIISTSSRTSHLDLTLASYARQSWRDFELIVVHPGSDYTASTVERWAEHMPARAIAAGETGRGAARNIGVRAADGDLVVLADEARIVPDNYLATLSSTTPDQVSLTPRHGIIPRWHFFLPGATARRLLSLMRKRIGVGAMLYDGMEHFFGTTELSAHFDDIVKGYRVDDFVWDRLQPMVAIGESFHAPWLLGLAGNLCVPRRALFEVGLCDPLFYGWDLEDPDLGYKLHRHGLSFRVCSELASWHQQRPFLTYPFCMIEALQRFAVAHDPVDAWLLLRFLGDEDARTIDALAAARPPKGSDSLVDTELQRAARELVPHLIHALGRWWAQDTGR